LWILFNPGDNRTLTNRLIAAGVIGSMTWVMWRATVYPAVVIEEAGLVVRNPFSIYVVPWASLGEVRTVNGLELSVAGRKPVAIWAFSRSLLGELTGNRSANRARSVLEGMRVSGSSRRDTRPLHRIDLGLRSLLLVWVIFGLVALAASANDPLL
jgi:hypothetical protein